MIECSSGDGLFGIFLRFGSDSGEYLLAGFLLRFSTWFPLGMLEVLRLLNEPSAAAVAYGLYRTSTDLPNAEQPVMSLSLILVLRLCRLLLSRGQ
ncbi:hypothetical protein OUZ56_033894 [Daphnia magna]|uniref:Uncharacterized protein n=1 Tax=Daphnia magna TaxID=35525 RepID=A0ABQ9ZYJ8_9CRUS|nr:hypothetical protein OUZ56_033894 [Daphnia magna]